MVEAKRSYRHRTRKNGKTTVTYAYKDIPMDRKYETLVALENRRSTDRDDIREFEFARKTNKILFRPHNTLKRTIEIVPWAYDQELTLGEPGGIQTLLDAQIRDYNMLSIYDPLPNLATWSHKYSMGELKTLAYAEANERELDVLTALAEMPETIKMFSDVAKALVKPRQTALKFFKQYQAALRKNGVNGVGVKALDDLTSAWLQYRYGIMPAYYLIQSLREQLDRSVKIFQNVRKKDIVTLESGLQKKISLPGVWNGPSYALCNYSIGGEHKLEFLIRRIYTLDQIQSKRFGYSIPATMWELTTLSFVVDWAIQVGDLITALTPTCADAEASAAITRVSYSIECELIAYAPRANEILRGQTGRFAAIKLDEYTRAVGSGTPSFEIPVGLQMNLKRTLDSFALSWPKIRQALTKGR